MAATPTSTQVPLWINGAAIQTSEHTAFPVVNGRTGDTLCFAANARLNDLQSIAASSWEAYRSWKCSSFATRRTLLQKFADVLERDTDKFVQTMVNETNCPPFFATFTHKTAISKAREAAASLYQVFGQVVPGFDDPAVHGLVFQEPVGPIILIAPWNTPTFLAVRAISQAIAAGCSVILKCSELSPHSHFMIVQALTEAGSPAGLLNSLQCTRQDAALITEALISDRRTRKVVFIGSASVGRSIAAVAGQHLKPVALELGGKCPALVMEDCDLRAAANVIVAGSMMYHGQLCMSTERVIVLDTIADAFKAALVAAFEAQPGVQGSAINVQSAQHAYDVVSDAKAKSCEFLLGEPHFQSPTTLAPVVVLNPRGTRMEDEETFGPSLSLYVVKDQQEAIDLANASDYGYSATIHTRDMDRAVRMARDLEYGIVNCNNIQFFSHTNSPTGGVKSTGWGRENGLWGIGEYLVTKTFTYKTPALS